MKKEESVMDSTFTARDLIVASVPEAKIQNHLLVNRSKSWKYKEGVADALRILKESTPVYARPSWGARWTRPGNTCTECGADALYDKYGNQVRSMYCPVCGELMYREDVAENDRA